MSIIIVEDPEEVKNAFIVQGANPDTLEYIRYTNTLQPVTMIVSNSSTTFDIQFFPTSSVVGIVFKTEEGVVVDNLSPITLSNVNGIKLSAIIDTVEFDTTPLISKTYDISFSLATARPFTTTTNNTITIIPTCASEGQILTEVVSTCCENLTATTEMAYGGNVEVSVCR